MAARTITTAKKTLETLHHDDFAVAHQARCAQQRIGEHNSPKQECADRPQQRKAECRNQKHAEARCHANGRDEDFWGCDGGAALLHAPDETADAPTSEASSDNSRNGNWGNISSFRRKLDAGPGNWFWNSVSIMPVCTARRWHRPGGHAELVDLTSAVTEPWARRGADGLAGMGFGGVAQEPVVGCVNQRVAAIENGQRRERVEAGCGAVEPRGAGGDGAEREAAERLAGGFEAAPRKGEPDGWVLPLGPRSEGRKLAGARAQVAVGDESEAVAEVVEALTAAADEGLQPVLHLGDRERVRRCRASMSW